MAQPYRATRWFAQQAGIGNPLVHKVKEEGLDALKSLF